MAKFSGKVGYVETTETAPGVHQEVATERTYFGDVVQNRRTLSEGDQANPTVTLANSLSVVADPYAREHFAAIRYVEWGGAFWKVVDVDASNPPRLVLRLGEVYNGLTA